MLKDDYLKVMQRIYKIHENRAICNDGLDYGINIDNHFYIRNHIISRPSIRDSDDEELVANILGIVMVELMFLQV